MRDPELILELLRDMANVPNGTVTMPLYYGASEQERKIRHHVDLLTDAGHAEWIGEHRDVVRITNEGYDILNAIEQNEELKNRFIDRFKRGMPYIPNTLDIVKKAAEFFGSTG